MNVENKSVCVCISVDSICKMHMLISEKAIQCRLCMRQIADGFIVEIYKKQLLESYDGDGN